jgi:hypothetical protein
MSDATPLDNAYDLSPTDLDSFRQNGWVLLRGVCPAPEMQTYGPAIQSAAMAHNTETRPLEDRDTYGRAFLQVMNLWRHDPVVAQYTLAKRFAGIAAQLLGVKGVRLYHDQALFKEPGGGHTPWHQDGFFWPIDQSKTVTMWMPLVDVPLEMGTMSFADGSQKAGIISLSSGISDQSEAYYEGFIDGAKLPVRTSGAMKAGDATFHSGLTLHKAPGNPTDRVRAVMTVIYFADGLTANVPQNDNQKADLASWFPGVQPGEPAASELNPLLVN